MEPLAPLNSLVGVIEEKLGEAIGAVVRQPVSLKLGHFGTMPLSEVDRLAGRNQATIIYVPLTGDVAADIFLVLNDTAGPLFVDMMMGNPVGTTAIIGEFEGSALKELGNITSGVVVSELANVLKLSIMLTTPNMVTDYPSAVIDQALISYAEQGTEAFALHLPFTITGFAAGGSFLLIVDAPGMRTIMDALSAGGDNVS
jgi:chemotaxis protein CheC